MGRNQTTPAIARTMNDTDRNVHVLHEFKSTVTRMRGLGDSGRIYQTVEHGCPVCTFDRMVREIRVNPEEPRRNSYWCLNPTCDHFVEDSLSHATSGVRSRADSPAVID